MKSEEIISSLEKAVQGVLTSFEKLSEGQANYSDGKWSAVENVRHLSLAARPLILAFSLPGFMLRLFGKPKYATRTYDQVVALYQSKLAAGAKASGPYIPNKKKRDANKETDYLKKTYNRLVLLLKGWPDKKLDDYRLPHPILGKITLREMLYFTIHHVIHHTKAIQRYET